MYPKTYDEDNVQTKHTRGCGLRSVFAGFLVDSAAAFLLVSALYFSEDDIFYGVMFMIIGLISTAAAVLQIFSASKGRESKGWNTVSIVLGAIFVGTIFGIVGIVGGVRGKKAIAKPEYDKKSARDGHRLRATFAIISLIFAIASLICGVMMLGIGYNETSEEHIATGWGLTIFGIYCTASAVVGFLSVKRGKTNRDWNTACIALSSIFTVLFFGIVGIVGGVRGNTLLPDKPRKVKEKSINVDSLNIATPPSGAVEIQEKPSVEYIQPKMSAKGKKAIMWTIVASYSILMLVGILLTAIPAMSKMLSGFGICEDINARAYGITIGVMWLALLPTIGYYFTTISPFELSKKNKIILSAVTTALLVVTNVVFFVIINAVKIDGLALKKFFENDDSWFVPLSMVFGSLASAICYALTLFQLNPQKIKTQKPTLSEGHKLLDTIVYVFKMIGYFVINLVKKILSFKEKQPDIFILVATILLTWLSFFTAFIFAIICIAIMITVALMYFVGVISLLHLDFKSQPIVKADEVLPSAKEYTYTDSNGYIQTIYSQDKKDFYDAGGRRVASSHDEGKTVEFISNDNNE